MAAWGQMQQRLTPTNPGLARVTLLDWCLLNGSCECIEVSHCETDHAVRKCWRWWETLCRSKCERLKWLRRQPLLHGAQSVVPSVRNHFGWESLLVSSSGRNWRKSWLASTKRPFATNETLQRAARPEKHKGMCAISELSASEDLGHCRVQLERATHNHPRTLGTPRHRPSCCLAPVASVRRGLPPHSFLISTSKAQASSRPQ